MSNNLKIKTSYGDNCEICGETTKEYRPICDKCMNALKDLILEKRRLNEESREDNHT